MCLAAPTYELPSIQKGQENNHKGTTGTTTRP
jgi:hypothetical protein